MATYYVSTTGNDGNAGTIGSSWATLNYAWSRLNAGDICYVRGGTYTYAMMGQTTLSNKSGTAGNMITISNYSGESPIINFSANTFTSQVIGIAMQNANYIYIKGLRITSINQPHSGDTAQYGMMLWDHVSNCTFEQVEIDHIGGWGTTIGDYCNDNLWLNCDGHHNSDPYTTINGNPHYGWSDGFQSASWDSDYIGSGRASTRNTFRNCRAYRNSDDGWDLRRTMGLWTFENCWSFWNGYIPGEKIGDTDPAFTTGGDGDGFKVGGNYGPSTTSILRILKNCLSVENRLCSYDMWNDIGSGGANPGGYVGAHIYNCISYNNEGVGFGMSDPTGASTTIIRNCISYSDLNTGYWYGSPWWTADHNSWDIPITVVNSDFANVSSVGMDGARQSNGNLPILTFLKPSVGSQLRGAGVYISTNLTDGIGNNFVNPPSIGAYEYLNVGPTLPTVSTTTITSITSSTATSGGNVTADGGASVTARGVCWSTTSSPTVSNTHTTDGSGTGSFTSNITGLNSSTIYYVRAYATNNQGTAYGNEIQFVTTTNVILATVTTQAVTNISYATATANGNLTSDGGDSNTVKGVCWALHTLPTTGDAVVGNSTGLGAFSVSLTGALTGTLHYVRAYATNTAGTSYGNQVQFTTLTPAVPALTTTAISAITQTTASSGGTVTSNNGSSITATGVCWSTATSPTTANSYTSDGTNTNWFSSITGLSVNTLYYVRAYAINSVGTGYGNQLTFTTGGSVPTVYFSGGQTYDNRISLNFTITSDGGSNITEKGVCWRPSTDGITPTINDSKTSDGSGNSPYTSLMTGLSPSTSYSLRGYAINSTGVGYGINFVVSTMSSWLCITFSKVKKWFCTPTTQDWFLPSINELILMYNELFLYGLGNFGIDQNQAVYSSSTENPNNPSAGVLRVRFPEYIPDGMPIIGTKEFSGDSFRACRTFQAPNGFYSLRDIGPSGGLIFYVNGTTYMEATPYDITVGLPLSWSNIQNAIVGTSSAVGTGQANTTAIINQPGHTNSLAKLCDDLIV